MSTVSRRTWSRVVALSTLTIAGMFGCEGVSDVPWRPSSEIHAEAVIAGILSSRVEVTAAPGRYVTPVIRRDARLSVRRNKQSLTTSSRALVGEQSPRLELIPTTAMSRARARGVASETTVALSARVNGKFQRVLFSRSASDEAGRPPRRVIRFVDGKLADVLDMTHSKVAGRWVATRGRLITFDAETGEQRTETSFDLSEVRSASASRSISRQAADVVAAFASTLLPKPLHADETEEGCLQLLGRAVGLSAAAAAAALDAAVTIAECATGNGSACAQVAAKTEAAGTAAALTAAAWSVYYQYCGPGSGGGGGGGGGGGTGVVCYLLVTYYVDTGEIIGVQLIGCW